MKEVPLSSLTRRRFLLSLAAAALGTLAGCLPRARDGTPTPPAATGVQAIPATPTVASSPTPTPSPSRPSSPTPTDTPVPTTLPTRPVSPSFTPIQRPSAQPSGRPVVAIARCQDYGTAQVEKAVRELVAQCGGLQDVVKPGATVVIKPNLTAGGRTPTVDGLPNILTYTTHPDVTRAIALLAKEAGAGRIILVEGWGADVWALNQYEALIQELGLETINLDEPAPAADFTAVAVKDALELREVLLHEAIAKADVLISVPKMKCHASCGITLSIKNLFGCTPLPRYRERSGDQARTTMHKGRWPERLPRILVDILQARPIDFAVVDAISTQDQGEGPWNNGVAGIRIRTVRPQLLLAGRNPVAVDAVGTAVMGFDPAAGDYEVPFTCSLNHIALAAAKGLGTNRVAEIEVRGLPVEQVRFPFTPCPQVSAAVQRQMHLARRGGAQWG